MTQCGTRKKQGQGTQAEAGDPGSEEQMWQRDPLSPGRCPLEDRTGLPQGSREVRPLLNDTLPHPAGTALWFLRPTPWSRGQGTAGRGEGLGGPAGGGASAGGRGQVDGPRGAPPQRCPNFSRLRWVLGGLTRHRRPSRSGAGVARLAQPLFCLQRRFQVPIKKVGGPLLERGGRSWGFAFLGDWVAGDGQGKPPTDTHTCLSPPSCTPL